MDIDDTASPDPGTAPPEDARDDPVLDPEEGVIDVTDSFDGMPIDISSPHRNYGAHREELM